MDLEILRTVGSIAGLGGLSIGMTIILFREIIRKNVFPKLAKSQAFRALRLIAILSWSLGLTGITAWTLVTTVEVNSRERTSQFRRHGRVLDLMTQQPIAGVKVTVESTELPVIIYADSNGSFHFDLSQRHQGAIARLRLEASGYETHERSIEMESRDLIDVRMKPTGENSGKDLTSEVNVLEREVARIAGIAERDRQQNEHLRETLNTALATIGDLIRILSERQGALQGTILLAPDDLRRREGDIKNLQSSIEAISSSYETAIAITPSSDVSAGVAPAPPQHSLDKRIEALRSENIRLQNELAAARRFATTGDLEALRGLFKPIEGRLTAGVIKSPEGTKVYSADEVDKFLEDAQSAASSSRPLGVRHGTDHPYFGCVPPGNDCGIVDFGYGSSSKRDDVRWQIQWYSGPPSPFAEAVLAQARRSRNAPPKLLLAGAICSLYNSLAQTPHSLSAAIANRSTVHFNDTPLFGGGVDDWRPTGMGGDSWHSSFLFLPMEGSDWRYFDQGEGLSDAGNVKLLPAVSFRVARDPARSALPPAAPVFSVS